MKPIDSVLRIMVEQGATELRLESDRRPLMFKGDVELPLTIPATSTATIHGLLDDLWTSAGTSLAERGRLSLPYRSAELGDFAVTLVQLEGAALQALFRRGDLGPEHSPGPARHEAKNSEEATAARPTERTEAIAELPPPIVTLLAGAASRGASDVHFTQGRRPIGRIDGELYVLDGTGATDVAGLFLRPAELEQVRAGRSIDRALDVPSVGRLRVNVYTSEDGVCAAVRILRREAPALEGLELPQSLESLVDLPHGLVIVCGPTGSGKSTTLAALAQRAMRSRARVLISLEDPIEYVIRPAREAGVVRQREVGTHVRDFATGLRDALREDPDILLVGEMRDAETIGLALTAAETGHLVLTSLHSRTAASAVERIVDTYPPERQRQIRVQLADALRAVIAQRLIPRASGAGRVPGVEVLRATYAVANLIREGRTAQIASALQAGGDEGMLPLERNLADLVRRNLIRHEAAVATANDPRTLGEYLRS